MYLTIGSGDIGDLLSGKGTEGHRKLWEKFLSDSPPHYNAMASTIDAFRTGAILEQRYFEILPDTFLSQGKFTCSKMDCLTVTLDFPEYKHSKLIDFEELKSVNFNDFLIIEKYINSDCKTYTDFIKKRYKKYYNQVQSQLYATGMASAKLVFLCVYSYDDNENMNRFIKANEVIKFRIYRDETIIKAIENRLTPFQQVRDYYTKN